MPKRVRTGLTRSDILDRYVERFKQQLVKFQPFLSRKRGSASLEDFDEAAEELIAQVFGAASDESEAAVIPGWSGPDTVTITKSLFSSIPHPSDMGKGLTVIILYRKPNFLSM